MKTPSHRLSVVILTHNRLREVLRTVAHMLALPERPPIIVVDNGSHDGSALRIKQEFPQVKVVPLAGNLGAAARNIGVRNADTPYVAFCDDDVQWAAGSLARGADLLDAHQNVALVSARVLVGDEQREDPVCAVMAASPVPSHGLPGRAVLGFLAGACMVRRDAFLAVGGYEPKFFVGGEEELVALDLVARGWTLVYCDALVVYHFPSTQRDLRMRRRLLVRNALWVTWMRRGIIPALRGTWRILRQGPRDRDRIAGFIEAVEGLPWALRNRRVIPRHVEAWCARIDSYGVPPGWTENVQSMTAAISPPAPGDG